MQRNVKLGIAVLGISAVAIFLAVIVRGLNHPDRTSLLTGIDPVPTSTQNGDATTTEPEPNVPSPEILSKTSCEASGGRWNECGSLCRGKPAGTVCAEVCVPQCECASDAQCPASHSCKEVIAGTGICAAGARKPAEVPVVKTYSSADKVTTLVFDDAEVRDGRVILGNPMSFHGTSTMFENQTSFTVKDGKGTTVAFGSIYVNSPDSGKPGPFSGKMFYDNPPKTKNGTFVFEGQDNVGLGNYVGRVSVPVEFTFTTAQGCDQQVAVYWGKKGESEKDTSLVFPVKHTVCALGSASVNEQAMREIALHELFKGTTPWEASKGYFTSLPAGLGFPAIDELSDGSGMTKFALDFPAGSFYGVAGSARVQAIESQLRETLGADAIAVTVDGQEALQP